MDSPVEQIKEKLPIEDVVGSYVELKRAGANFKARCPFHKERTPSFMVSPERGTYMCFGCGERGDVFSFVQKMEGIDFPTTLKQLAERAGVELPKQQWLSESKDDKEKHEKLLQICEEAAKYFVQELQKRKDVLKYLHTRGLKDETVFSWQIGYAPATWRSLTDHLIAKGFSKQECIEAGLSAKLEKREGEEERVYDRFRGRITFPIFDLSGRCIAFSGRFFEKVPGAKAEAEPAKYVNSPETEIFKKSKVLYGLDRAKGFIRKADCALMVEGQFDLVLSHQSGLPFAVAVSGTALTEAHLSLLSRFTKRLVLALDADEAGLRAGLKSAAMAYALGFDVKIPNFGSAKDPADIAKENPELLKAAIRTSETAIEFFLKALRPLARDERGYKRLVEAQVLPLVALLGSRIDQEHFIEIIAQRLGTSLEAVRAEVAKKPTLQSENLETQDEPTIPPVSSFSHALAMLQFYFEDDEAIQKEVVELVGEEVYHASLEKNLPDAEKFRFEFESLGEEKLEGARDLLLTLKRAKVKDEIEEVNRKLREGSGANEGLLEELINLKREEQELRN